MEKERHRDRETEKQGNKKKKEEKKSNVSDNDNEHTKYPRLTRTFILDLTISERLRSYIVVIIYTMAREGTEYTDRLFSTFVRMPCMIYDIGEIVKLSQTVTAAENCMHTHSFAVFCF